MEGTLKTRYDRVKQKALEHCAKPGNSQAKLAHALPNVGTATLSAFLTGNYQGNVEKIVKKLEDFFDLSQARFDLVVEPSYVKTSVSRRVMNGIKQCHVLRSVAVIIGPAGVGKTRTAREYARERTGVYYLEIDPYMTNRHDFMRGLCQVVDVPPTKNARDAFLRVREKAAQQGALIILDEAQRISSNTKQSFNAFEVLRSLNDAGVGVVLMGNSRVVDRVTTTYEVDFYQQFCSRAEVRNLDNETFTEREVRDVIAGMYDGPMSEEVFDYLFTAATEYVGSLRIMIRALNMAVLRANAHDDTLALRYVQEAMSHVLSRKKPKAQEGRRKLNAKKTAGMDTEPRPEPEQARTA